MDLTERGRKLHDAVIDAADSLDERLLVLLPLAVREGASEADMRMVREILLEGRVRVCRDQR